MTGVKAFENAHVHKIFDFVTVKIAAYKYFVFVASKSKILTACKIHRILLPGNRRFSGGVQKFLEFSIPRKFFEFSAACKTQRFCAPKNRRFFERFLHVHDPVYELYLC